MSKQEQPDPGEGWRLLERGEVVMEGDHFKRDGEDWRDVINPGYVYSSGSYWTHRRRIITTAELLNRVTNKPDLVNSPPHYRQGDIECIDAIRSALTDEEFRGYVKGNAIKYLWREKHKGGDEDLKKAAWYLSRIETKESTK
jgi:hypothetical protein